MKILYLIRKKILYVLDVFQIKNYFENVELEDLSFDLEFRYENKNPIDKNVLWM